MADELVTKVPNWVLRNILMPNGKRLPKWEPLKEPVKRRDALTVLEQYHRRHLPEMYRQKIPSQQGGKVGNLPLDLYRFWVGHPTDESEWSMCRACGEVVFDEFPRVSHKNAMPPEKKCTVILVKAYRKLLDHRTCPICAKKTYHNEQRFGVPLHPQCEWAWMFGKQRWPILIGALKECGYEPGGGVVL